jgi:hypothetical protein
LSDWRIIGGPLHVPRHIFIFDDRDLRQALHRANFVDIETSFGLRTEGWSAGAQNLLADRAGLSTVRPRTVVQRLDRDFTSVTLIQAVVSKTATVAFRARKRSLSTATWR